MTRHLPSSPLGQPPAPHAPTTEPSTAGGGCVRPRAEGYSARRAGRPSRSCCAGHVVCGAGRAGRPNRQRWQSTRPAGLSRGRAAPGPYAAERNGPLVAWKDDCRPWCPVELATARPDPEVAAAVTWAAPPSPPRPHGRRHRAAAAVARPRPPPRPSPTPSGAGRAAMGVTHRRPRSDRTTTATARSTAAR